MERGSKTEVTIDRHCVSNRMQRPIRFRVGDHLAWPATTGKLGCVVVEANVMLSFSRDQLGCRVAFDNESVDNVYDWYYGDNDGDAIVNHLTVEELLTHKHPRVRALVNILYGDIIQ